MHHRHLQNSKTDTAGHPTKTYIMNLTMIISTDINKHVIYLKMIAYLIQLIFLRRNPWDHLIRSKSTKTNRKMERMHNNGMTNLLLEDLSEMRDEVYPG